MKKLLITLLTALLLSGAAAQTAFPDIPENHWAADAVARIADLGIVIGFPDGTFRGNEAFTRYQSALVISRMLDVLQSNIDASKAMTDADIASLRNAVQELASDVAAQGVRLAAAESAVASISDDVVANSARLDALEAKLEEMMGMGGVDPQVLQDLQNQIASLRVAVDTAQAQAEAAESLAGDALDAANAAATRARENAAAIDSINQLLGIFGDDIEELKARPLGEGVPQGLVDQVERNTSDIANIREFVILLRRDQVATRDRVSALEASDAAQEEMINELKDRVSALEDNLFDISGSISIDYDVTRGSGPDFDFDRAFGSGFPREMESFFTTGEATTDEGDNEKKADFTGPNDGTVTPTLSVSFGFNPMFDGVGPGGYQTFSTVIDFIIDADSDGSGYDIQVDSFTTTYDPIGSGYLTFAYGTEVTALFTPYLVNIDEEEGYVATAGGVPFLAFLDPTLTVVYSAAGVDEYTRGARLTLNPLEGVTLGGSFGQHAMNAGDHADVNNDNVETTVFGGDAQVSLSIFDLGFEFATSSTNGTSNGNVLFVTLDVDGSGLPILDRVSANFRDVDATFNGIKNDTGDDPFELGQNGFGVEVGLSLFILDVTGFFDSYTPDTFAAEQGFGVQAMADLFAGFSITGFFEQASTGGAVVDATTEAREVDIGNTLLDGDYETKWGVTLAHDGAAANALIPNLDLEGGIEFSTADFSRTKIFVDADYMLSVSILTIEPYAGYESINDTDAGTDDTVTIKAGASVETDPLNIIMMPSLNAKVNYRTTSHSDLDTYTATELQWSVGLTLNEFLFEHSTLSASYGTYSGTNVDTTVASGIGVDTNRGDLTAATSGYEVVWNYYGLEFGYGVFTSDLDTSTAGIDSVAQKFTISYTVEF